MNFLHKWFGANQEQKTSFSALDNESIENKEDNFVNVQISLNKNFDIDLVIYLKNIEEESLDNQFNYAMTCAEFFHILNSGKLKDQILDILQKKIKNIDNKILIDSIITFISIIEKQQEKILEKASDKVVVKPSQVFTKYHGNI